MLIYVRLCQNSTFNIQLLCPKFQCTSRVMFYSKILYGLSWLWWSTMFMSHFDIHLGWWSGWFSIAKKIQVWLALADTFGISIISIWTHLRKDRRNSSKWFWKNDLRTCIYRSMRVAVSTKMDNGQISNKEKFKMTVNNKKNKK